MNWEKLKVKVKEVVQWYFVSGILYGMAGPLLLLGLAVKNSVVILFGFAGIVFGFVSMILGNKAIKEVSKFVEQEKKKEAKKLAKKR